MCKSEDMAGRIKESFSSCEKIAAREMDTIFKGGFLYCQQVDANDLIFLLSQSYACFLSS